VAGVVDAGLILIVGVKDTNEQLIAGENDTLFMTVFNDTRQIICGR
jgi:hypothetical protein